MFSTKHFPDKMISSEIALAQRLLKDFSRGKFDSHFLQIRQRVKKFPECQELLQKYLINYYRRCDYSFLDENIQDFLNQLKILQFGHSININSLITQSIRLQTKFTQHSIVTGFTSDFADIEVVGKDIDRYVYNITPIRIVPTISETSPSKTTFFLDDRGFKLACQVDDNVIISGNCMWKRLDCYRDSTEERLIFVDQYEKSYIQ